MLGMEGEVVEGWTIRNSSKWNKKNILTMSWEEEEEEEEEKEEANKSISERGVNRNNWESRGVKK